MRKFITFLLALVLIASLAVTSFAVTPRWEYKAVKIPQIKPDTSFVQGAISRWFIENPIDLPPIKIEFVSPTIK